MRGTKKERKPSLARQPPPPSADQNKKPDNKRRAGERPRPCLPPPPPPARKGELCCDEPRENAAAEIGESDREAGPTAEGGTEEASAVARGPVERAGTGSRLKRRRRVLSFSLRDPSTRPRLRSRTTRRRERRPTQHQQMIHPPSLPPPPPQPTAAGPTGEEEEDIRWRTLHALLGDEVALSDLDRRSPWRPPLPPPPPP